MFKVLHISIYARLAKGVENQLAYECSAAPLLKPVCDWETKVFALGRNDREFFHDTALSGSGGFWLTLLNFAKLNRAAFKWLRRNQSRYDAIVLRYVLGDVNQCINSYWFDNVFTIHHTFEIEEARLGRKIFSKLLPLLEKYLGRHTINNVRGVIGITEELVGYEQSRCAADKPGFSYPNGIDLSMVECAEDRRGGDPQLMMVSSRFTDWQGLDLLTDALGRSARRFVLHVVGEVPNQLAVVLIADDRFVLHGTKEPDAIRSIAGRCDLAIGVCALHRKGMEEACPLKVRDYLAYGIPVYATHKDPAFPVSFPYYTQGRLDPDEILDLSRSCRKLSRQEVRSASEPYIEKLNLMRSLVNWLRQQIVE